ncbi:MAG: hypothetical protein JWR32_3652 [Mycobacterium sp.]|jgi:hypothetical protein|nr:hypothetical protein [Mycobacterium sp.]
MTNEELIQHGKNVTRQVSYSLAAQLLDDIKAFLQRFVVYPSNHELVAHVLWIGHTWLMDRWESTPRIAFLSPEPASGKSRALEVSEGLVPRPVHAVNTSPAYLFRKVSDPDGRPTILYDEIDTVFGPKAKDNEDIRGMLNAGHRKGATAGRCVLRGKNVETEELPAYCAVALAGLDDLPDTIMTRSVVVRMRRRAANEPIEPWRQRINGPQAAKLHKRLFEWSSKVTPSWPEIPDEVTDRDADVWEALLAVADLAGDRWAEAARKAAVTLVTASRQRTPSTGILLLRDIKKVFERAGEVKLPTEEVLAALSAMAESPWAVIRRGEPIDNRGLSNRLKKYGIGPKLHRDGDKVFRGYARSQFEDAWKRYLEGLPDDDEDDEEDPHPSGDPPVTSVTPVAEPVTAVTDVTHTQADERADRSCACGAQLANDNATGMCAECAFIKREGVYG